MSENNKMKFYHVRFKDSPDGSGAVDFYFGSLAAIYDVFSSEQVGCKLENLWNKKLSSSLDPWVGSRCSVFMCELIRKKTKRGGRS